MAITLKKWEETFEELPRERLNQLSKAIKTLESDSTFKEQFGWTGLFALKWSLDFVHDRKMRNEAQDPIAERINDRHNCTILDRKLTDGSKAYDVFVKDSEKVGEYAVLARRSGESWFIGAMNGEEPHTFDVTLDFLDKDRQYTAHIYSDDPAVSTRTHVKINRHNVDSSSVLKFELPPRRGQAIRIHPLK